MLFVFEIEIGISILTACLTLTSHVSSVQQLHAASVAIADSSALSVTPY